MPQHASLPSKVQRSHYLDLDRNSPQKKAAVLGEKHRGYVCDVTRRDACEEVARQIIADFGSIEILIKNAGITQPIRILDVKPENYDAVLDVSLRGMLYRGGRARSSLR
jgi:NAD(P)-dependent dehydrogenase (short-subunit alcohol dehydrogenase family)